jgi:enterochelin esterase family protein
LHLNKHIKKEINSKALKRNTIVDFYFPLNYKAEENLPFLLLNDGQDAQALQLENILQSFFKSNPEKRFILIAAHAGERVQEYGVIDKPDAHQRGSKAGKYADFVIKELLPLAQQQYNIDLHHPLNCIAGFSLGGLMAVSLAWNYPQIFKKVGAFSGSFWWRSKDINQGYTDQDRIMHSVIRKSKIRTGLKFWFQAGTDDETSDRNNNGIIDAIDDTLDLIAELIKLGYKPYYDVCYYEMQGGKHNQETWSKALPEFWDWAF